MQSREQGLYSIFILAAVIGAIAMSPAQGQSISTTRSLGGYGATSTSPMAAMGSASAPIPYAGSFGGFMPYRMSGGTGNGVSLSSRKTSAINSSRTSFGLAPMASGMGAEMGDSRAGSLAPLFRPQKTMGLNGARLMNQPMGAGGRSSIMPPNFGYPFYQPPSLLSPAGAAAGMSM